MRITSATTPTATPIGATCARKITDDDGEGDARVRARNIDDDDNSGDQACGNVRPANSSFGGMAMATRARALSTTTGDQACGNMRPADGGPWATAVAMRTRNIDDDVDDGCDARAREKFTTTRATRAKASTTMDDDHDDAQGNMHAPH